MSEPIEIKAVLAGDGPGTFWPLEREIEVWDALLAARGHIEVLEKGKGGVDRALFYLRQIAGAVDGVMADWESGKSAELVPTTIGQWAERAIIELAALATEESPTA